MFGEVTIMVSDRVVDDLLRRLRHKMPELKD